MKKLKGKYSKRLEIIGIVILLIICSFSFLRITLEKADTFFTPSYDTQYKEYKKLYYSSQYVQKKNPVIITDEVFEAFAGGAFLKGLNPILIVHDHPPLGRYVVSLSIPLFNNPHTIILPLLALSAFGFFLLSRAVIKHTLLALIPLVVFLNEPLFYSKLIFTPLPEPIQLPFIVFSLVFFIKGISTKHYTKWFICTSLMLGGVISTRYFVLGATLVAAMMIFFALRREFGRRLITFLLTLPLSLVVLLLSYTRTILDGASVVEIFRIQKYIFAYHQSKFIEVFSFWDLLFFNRWHTWWGNREISSDPQWHILWPLSMMLTILHLVAGFVRKVKLNDAEIVLFIWVLLYCAMLSTGYTSTRYFFPLIPLLYILATSFIIKIVRGVIK